MRSKKSVLILLCSFLIATLILLAVLFFMLQTGNLSKRTASIALPSEGGFVEAWTQHLPQIARHVNIPEITILTYDNYDKLKTYFLQAEKYNLLWAEIPVSGEYNLQKLLSEVQTSVINNRITDLYPPALFKAIKSYTGKSDIRFIPLSYNPWVVINRKDLPQNTEFEYSTGAHYEDGAFATLAFVRDIKKTGKKFLTIDEGLSELKEMSNDKGFITNPKSYTFKDAYSVLESGKVKKTILPIYFYNSLSVAQRLELTVEPLSSEFIADATVAVFANRKTEEAILSVEKSKTYLLNTELLYSTANARLWMPAHINTVSRSIYTDYIRKQARQASTCFIPQTQFNSKKEKDKLLEKLEIAFRSNYLPQ